MEVLDWSGSVASEIRELHNPAMAPAEKSRRMMALFPQLMAGLTVPAALRSDGEVTKSVMACVLSTINSPGTRVFARELLALFVAMSPEAQLSELAQRSVSAASTLLVDGPEHAPAPETARAFVEDAVLLLEDLTQLCGACGLQPGVWNASTVGALVASAPTVILAFERLAALPQMALDKRPRRLHAVQLPLMLDVSSLDRTFRLALYLLKLLTVLLQRAPAVVAEHLSTSQAIEISAYYAHHGPHVLREAALLLLEAQLLCAPVRASHTDAVAASLLTYLSVPAHDASLRSRESDLVAARCVRLVLAGSLLTPASLHALHGALPRLIPDNSLAPLELHEALVMALTAALPHSPELAATVPRHLRPLFGAPELQPSLVACLKTAVQLTFDVAAHAPLNVNGGKRVREKEREEAAQADGWPAVLDGLLAELERPEGGQPRDWKRLLLAPNPRAPAALLSALVAVTPPRFALRRLKGFVCAALMGTSGLDVPHDHHTARHALRLLLDTSAHLVCIAEASGVLVTDLQNTLLTLASLDQGQPLLLPDVMPAAAPLLAALAPSGASHLVPRFAHLMSRSANSDPHTHAPAYTLLVTFLRHIPLFYARLPSGEQPTALRQLLKAMDDIMRNFRTVPNTVVLDALVGALAGLSCVACGAPAPANATEMPLCDCLSADTSFACMCLPSGAWAAPIASLTWLLSRIESALPAMPAASRLLTHVTLEELTPLISLYLVRCTLTALSAPTSMARLAALRDTLAGQSGEDVQMQAVSVAWLGKGVVADALGDAVAMLYPLQINDDPRIVGRAYDALRALQRAHGMPRFSAFLLSFAPLLAPMLAREPSLLPAAASVSLFDCTPVQFYRRTLSVSLPALFQAVDAGGEAHEQLLRKLVTDLADRSLRPALLHHAPDILAVLLPLHSGKKKSAKELSASVPSLALLERLTDSKMARLLEIRGGTLDGEPDPPLLLVQLLIAAARHAKGGEAGAGAKEALDFMVKTLGEQSLAALLRRDFFHIMLTFNLLLLPEPQQSQTQARVAISIVAVVAPNEVLGGLEQLLALIAPEDAASAATRVHVRTTLRYGLSQPSLRASALACWRTYVLRLPSAASLGAQLAQLVADVLPAVQCKEHAPAALELMQVLAKAGADFTQLPFLLPAVPALEPLLAAMALQAQTPSLPQLLEQLCQSCVNEECDVRRAALDRVAGVLSDQRAHVAGLIMDGESVAAPIARLLEALLQCTRDDDLVTREKAVRALGVLGAIDPRRVEGRALLRPDARRVPTERKLAVDLLEGALLKGLVAHAATQARAAATIQRILSEVLAVKPNAPEESAWWMQLSESTRHLVQPYLHTHYLLPQPDARPRAGTLLQRSGSYRDWCSEWALRMALHLPHDAPSLFRIIQPLLLRKDQELAIAVLPSLALHTAQASTRHALLLDEMKEVFHAASAMGDAPSPLAQRAAETCFALLDYLNRWLEDKRAAMPSELPAMSPSKRLKQKAQREQRESQDPAMEAVAALLASLSPSAIVQAACRCRAYPRALMQLESHVHANNASHKPKGGAPAPLPHADLQRVMGGLGDTDALAGIAALRGAATTDAALEAQPLEHTGHWLEAAQLYQTALGKLGASADGGVGVGASGAAEAMTMREGQARCLAHLDLFDELLAVVQSMAHSQELGGGMSVGLRHTAIEAAWRLGHWDRLEQLTGSTPASVSIGGGGGVSASVGAQHALTDTPELHLGRALLALHRRDAPAVTLAVGHARRLLLEPLAAASDSYVRSYPLLLQLHVLHEVELAACPDTPLAIMLPARSMLAQPNHITQEALLVMRSVLLANRHLQAESAGLGNGNNGNGALGSTWLELCKLARKAHDLPRARAALHKARLCHAEGVVLEEAKLAWLNGEQPRAMRLLHAEEMLLATSNAQLQLVLATHGLGAVRLRTARWLQESGQRASPDVINKYKESITSGAGGWEKAHFLLARYYDALLVAQRQPGSARNRGALDAKQCTYLTDALASYGDALKHGHKRLFHALPRMLTLWLDYTGMAAEQRERKAETRQVAEHAKALKALEAVMTQANRIIKQLISDLPAYVWLTALPQLLSRLLHRHLDAYEHIRMAVMSLLHALPQQTLWALQASQNASARDRQTKAKGLVDEAMAKAPGKVAGLPRLVDAARKLGEALIDLCNAHVPQKSRHMSLARDCRRLLAARGEALILPLQSSLTPCLPPSEHTHATHAPFGILPCFSKFRDDVDVLNSLQRPRKLTVLASDGRDYIFLCKPKDDLRRDARMMEFNTLVNKLMGEAAEARRRALYVRTYGVVPLNEECGLIEWVPNTQPMRPTILPLYGHPSDGSNELTKTIKAHLNSVTTELPLSVVFEQRLQPMFQPCLFHRWFLSSWPEPYSWLEARQRYVRSTALMSMVGAVIGLGDRHGENILLDSRTGDAVHVDFNCLFWKGKTFQQPERVPFRLTQNMVDALGVLGIEGPFRRSAEVALTVLRANRESLLSVLETFVHDPAVDPTRERDTDKDKDSPARAMAEIERMLSGRLQEGVVLSVEGQVHQLIEEATSCENLAHMYVGWNAWL